MGQTIKNLSSRPVKSETVFHNRFVVEICEHVHVHYRNLRIILSLKDWVEMARGMAESLSRWEKRGSPATSPTTHIELCRKTVASAPVAADEVKVNLNRNLYPLHKGRVFSEGAQFDEAVYIHLKIRDLRLELSLDEFSDLADAILEAKDAIKKGEAHV